MAKKKERKKKEKLDFNIIAIVAVLVIFAVGIVATGQTTEEAFPVYTTETPETITGKGVIEEKNIVGRAFKLDDCLRDCQYEICKKNCAKGDGTLEPGCFRNCLDECNNKCLKVYKW